MRTMSEEWNTLLSLPPPKNNQISTTPNVLRRAGASTAACNHGRAMCLVASPLFVPRPLRTSAMLPAAPSHLAATRLDSKRPIASLVTYATYNLHLRYSHRHCLNSVEQHAARISFRNRACFYGRAAMHRLMQLC
jgi:hypothetical protein